MKYRLLLFALAGLIMTACSPLTSKEPPPDSYRLHGADFQWPGAVTLPEPMIIATPVLPGVLAGDRVVLYIGTHTVSQYAGVRWAAPLDELIHRALIEALEQHARGAVDPAIARSAEFLLRVVVHDFQAVYPEGADPSADRPPQLAVGLALAVVESRTGRVVAQSRSTRRESADANRIGAITAGLNRLLMEAFSEGLATLKFESDEDTLD